MYQYVFQPLPRDTVWLLGNNTLAGSLHHCPVLHFLMEQSLLKDVDLLRCFPGTYNQFNSVHSSVLSDSLGPKDCSIPGFAVHHQLPEPAQIHVQRVSDAIQSSHPLSSPSPADFNLSQCQGLLKIFNKVQFINFFQKSFAFDIKNIYLFNWRIIAFQYFVGFCPTTIQINHNYMYVPSFLNSPPTHLTPLF